MVLTKLDGTAKGGVILAIADEFKLPVRFVGVGEKSDDLREFDPRDFVDALFARDGDEEPTRRDAAPTGGGVACCDPDFC